MSQRRTRCLIGPPRLDTGSLMIVFRWASQKIMIAPFGRLSTVLTVYIGAQ
jgi:hypothetical protein